MTKRILEPSETLKRGDVAIIGAVGNIRVTIYSHVGKTVRDVAAQSPALDLCFERDDDAPEPSEQQQVLDALRTAYLYAITKERLEQLRQKGELGG